MVKKIVFVHSDGALFNYKVTSPSNKLKPFVKWVLRLLKADVCNTYHIIEIMTDNGFVVFQKTSDKEHINYIYTSTKIKHMSNIASVDCVCILE